MEIVVRIEAQHAFFQDFTSINFLQSSLENEEIYIKPIFSEEWQSLYKYIVFSKDCFEYNTSLIDEELIKVPEGLLCAPGVAFYFFGKETSFEEHEYHLPTNFLKIGVEANG